tara:strand:+ start:5435 stop:5884 length:450 start_codon:yes stop_codon:yes gene_type:complete
VFDWVAEWFGKLFDFLGDIYDWFKWLATEWLPDFIRSLFIGIGEFLSELFMALLTFIATFVDLIFTMLFHLTAVPIFWIIENLAHLCGLDEIVFNLSSGGGIHLLANAVNFLGHFFDFQVFFSVMACSISTYGIVALIKFCLKLIPTVG